MPDAFPLAWPVGWPRTPDGARRRAPYTFGQPRRIYQSGAADAPARDFLLDELRRLGARNVVLSTNVELRQDGLPYARRRTPDDPGVAVYFTLDGESRCIPCDRWDRVADNLYAVARTISALRQLDRDGTHRMVSAAFSGFKALPEAGSGTPWWEVLGVVSGERDPEVLKRFYRLQAAKLHPDRGGDPVAFAALTSAYQQACAAAGVRP